MHTDRAVGCLVANEFFSYSNSYYHRESWAQSHHQRMNGVGWAGDMGQFIIDDALNAHSNTRDFPALGRSSLHGPGGLISNNSSQTYSWWPVGKTS